MISLPQGAAVDETNPKLFFIAQLEGRLVDLFSLSFEIFQKVSKEQRVCPESIVASTPVNLVTDRVSLGHYFARHTFAATEKAGLYEIRWTWEFEDGGETYTAGYEFEVVEGSGVLDIGGSGYALVEDIRDEGISKTVTDGRIQMAIILASRMFEEYTGRFFEPRKMVQRHSGRGARMQMIMDPIIGIDSVGVDSEPSSVGDLSVDLLNLRIFNRHLQGMMMPDDRDAPKLEFVHSRDLIGIGTSGQFQPLSGISFRSLAFPAGVQNIGINGFFGFTEPDGTPFGRTPRLVRHAIKMLVLREVPLLTDPSCREQLTQKWRVKEERVRDQTIKYADERKMGSFTGDPEIDTIILMHTRPPMLGAA